MSINEILRVVEEKGIWGWDDDRDYDDDNSGGDTCTTVELCEDGWTLL